jgi:hypothetical protein
MRLHPSTWERPSFESAPDVIRKSVTGAVIDRIPMPRRSAADAPTSPKSSLAEAWMLHQHARAAAEAVVPDAVVHRLRSALEAQERQLRRLSTQLGYVAPPIPAQRQGADNLALASQYVRSAEDAIDRTEDAAAQPRRLASWSARGRNALVYAATALVFSAPVALTLFTSSSWGALALVAVQCLVLPWVSLGVGALAVGRLFRPWVGGPVPRSPMVGALVVLATHAAVAVVAGLLSVVS